MASARECLQWTIILFNAFSVIIGILGIAGTVYEMFKYSEGSVEYAERIVQLIAASLLVISAFVGCCGAVNGSITVLCVFIGMLLALIVSHIWKLWRYDELKQLTAAEMLVNSSWIEELVKQGPMDDLQEMYECCGRRGPNDYSSLKMKIPGSCFRLKKATKSTPFSSGCMTTVKATYLEIYRYEKLAHCCLLGFETLGILLTAILICKITAKTRRYRY